MYLQKVIEGLTKIAGSASGSISQRYGTQDPDPDPDQNNFIDFKNCFEGDLLKI
jgi:hypothetical protein